MLRPLSDLHVAIVGLGLIGGSLALGLRPHVGHLTGIDRDPATLNLARNRNLVDVATEHVDGGLRGADLVLLATPILSILDLLRDLPRLRPDGCLVLDVGSTKVEICRSMAALPPAFQAMGGHPMCGREKSGLGAADGTLFRGQTFALSQPRQPAGPDVNQIVRELIDVLGAVPVYLPPERHDQIVALTSHLPYLLAALLVRQAAAAAEDDERVWQVSAGGLRDTTRLAGSDARMMHDILVTNRSAVLGHLHDFRQALDELESLLKAPTADLHHWLAERRADYGVYRASKGGSATEQHSEEDR